MKKLIFTLFIVFIFQGCLKKTDCYQDSGTIIGFDYRKCMCCGGWFIRIDSDTLRFQQVPEDCTINFDSISYPFDVYLDWFRPDSVCLGDEIVVTRMKARE